MIILMPEFFENQALWGKCSACDWCRTQASDTSISNRNSLLCLICIHRTIVHFSIVFARCFPKHSFWVLDFVKPEPKMLGGFCRCSVFFPHTELWLGRTLVVVFVVRLQVKMKNFGSSETPRARRSIQHLSQGIQLSPGTTTSNSVRALCQ